MKNGIAILLLLNGLSLTVHAALGTAETAAFKADTEAPVIELSGADSVDAECGLPYADAGATATDVCYGNLSSAIQITGVVNTEIPGVYSIRYNVSDGAGNAAAEMTRTVTVRDTTAPSITLNGNPLEIVAYQDAYTDAGAIASDACDGDLTSAIVTDNPVNTQVLGEYYVRFNVEDEAGNAATEVVRTVQVKDTTPPTILRCAPNRSSNADANCQGRIPDFSTDVEAEDDYSQPIHLRVEQLPAANTLVPTGVHSVLIRVYDEASNEASCSVNFTVTESTDPEITHCPQERTVFTGDVCLAAVPDFTTEVTAQDNCTSSEALVVSQTPTPGTMRGLGDHEITMVVRDASGNSDSCTIMLTVSDNSAPEVTIEGGNELTGECHTPLTLPDATAQDVCAGDVETSITDMGGLNVDMPEKGTYHVVYGATDDYDNTGTATLTVTILDTDAPEITLNGAATATLECGDVYEDQGATAHDVCDGDISSEIVTDNPVDSHKPGTYVVRYTVEDNEGNTAVEKTRTVIVQDTQKPVIDSCVSDTSIDANLNDIAAMPDVTDSIAANDSCAGQNLTIAQTPAPGTELTVGEHIVQITVSDPSGNTETCPPVTFTVNAWPWRYGDANLDRVIDTNDITEIMRLIAGGAPSNPTSRITADVNRDGRFTEADMLAVFSFIRSGGIVTEIPRELMAQSGVDEIVLLWGPVPHDNVRGYIVERRVGETSPWVRLPEVSDAVCYDENIESLRYQYRVAVVDMLGNVEPFSDPPVEVLGNTLTLWAPAAYGKTGDAIIAPIGVSSTRGLNPKNISITVNYDAAQADFLGVLTTVLSAQLKYIAQKEPGKVTIIATAPDGKLPIGEGRFFDLRMRLKSDAAQGCKDTSLSNVVILNNEGGGVATNPVAGSLCVGDARWGDVNGDGIVSIDDAQLLLEFAVRLKSPSAAQLFLGDMNGDRRLDAADAVLILRLAQNYSINPEQIPQKNGADEFSNRRVYFAESLAVPENCSLVVPVLVDDARAVAGMDLVLSFTRYDLECVAVCPSPATADFGFKTTLAEGYARISFGDALAMPSGETILAYLIFTATGQPTTETNPAPKVRINYAELKGELGQSFRWYADVLREDAEIIILPGTDCAPVPDCGALAAQEGETPDEGEAEEGEKVTEGEGEVAEEGEGETIIKPAEGEEGEKANEGEGEDKKCGCRDKAYRLSDFPRRILGDWLLMGLSFMILAALREHGNKSK